MRELLVQIALAFGTLLAIVNPVSAAFVFQNLTAQDPADRRRRLARTASVTSVIVLLAFLFFGEYVLAFFGITIYAFRVAGGIYLGWIAFEMLGKSLRNNPDEYRETGDEIAIIPLAVPLLSGPGSMASVMVMHSTTRTLAVGVAIGLIGVASFLVLINAERTVRLLGRTGTNVVERILGLLVLVIAVQFLFNGIAGFLAVVR